MAMLTPLTHDDWDWYSNYGIQMLQERFANLNGRYLGNMLEIIAVRLIGLDGYLIVFRLYG